MPSPLRRCPQPHAIVVGASHPEARYLEYDLQGILTAILETNPRFQIGAQHAAVRGAGMALVRHRHT